MDPRKYWKILILKGKLTGVSPTKWLLMVSNIQMMKTKVYTSTSGLGRMMQYIKQKNHWWMDVAVIGLWAWIINTYCWQNDSFIFFEIDQEVYDLAQWYFTFLDHCKEKEIKIWDARKLLWIDEKNNKKYDIIIIDAYSDDAVPAHLITSEAAKLYLSLLKQNGIIAIHISSRYLDLLPVISGLTQDNSLFWRFISIFSRESFVMDTAHKRYNLIFCPRVRYNERYINYFSSTLDWYEKCTLANCPYLEWIISVQNYRIVIIRKLKAYYSIGVVIFMSEKIFHFF